MKQSAPIIFITVATIVCTLYGFLHLCLNGTAATFVRRLAAEGSAHHHSHGCLPVKYLYAMHTRTDIGFLLKAEGKTIGAELGVQKGGFFDEMIGKWQIADTYTFVDLWAPQENYRDGANVDQSEQNAYMEESMGKADKHIKQGHLKKIDLCRNFTVNCVHNYPDEHFDFIYVDARHDYKGVLVDLQTWWPKLKHGGIMGGHDYIIQAELDHINRNYRGPKEDWTLNYDGTRDTTGRIVKGAVDDFFSDTFGDLHGCPRQTVITYHEPHIYVSWFVRK